MKVPANLSADRLILDYLSRVTVAGLHYLPKGGRIAFVGSTRSRIERECGPVGLTDPARVRDVLASLGEPEDLVRAERARLDAERIQRQARAKGTGDAAPAEVTGHLQHRPINSRWKPATQARPPVRQPADTGPRERPADRRGGSPEGKRKGRLGGLLGDRPGRQAAQPGPQPPQPAGAAGDQAPGVPRPPAPGAASAQAPGWAETQAPGGPPPPAPDGGAGTPASPAAPGGGSAEIPGGTGIQAPGGVGAQGPGWAGTRPPDGSGAPGWAGTRAPDGSGAPDWAGTQATDGIGTQPLSGMPAMGPMAGGSEPAPWQSNGSVTPAAADRHRAGNAVPPVSATPAGATPAGATPAGAPPAEPASPLTLRGAAAMLGRRMEDLAWDLARLVRRWPLESAAVVLLGIGGLILPFPLWLLGGLLTIWSRIWVTRDKWIAIIGPPVFTLVGTLVTAVIIGGQGKGLTMYVHAMRLDIGYLLRAGSLLCAIYLVLQARRGPRRRLPPWRR
jgi:hypothetical protein